MKRNEELSMQKYVFKVFFMYGIPPVIKIDISRRIKEKIKVNKLLMP